MLQAIAHTVVNILNLKLYLSLFYNQIANLYALQLIIRVHFVTFVSKLYILRIISIISCFIANLKYQ